MIKKLKDWFFRSKYHKAGTAYSAGSNEAEQFGNFLFVILPGIAFIACLILVLFYDPLRSLPIIGNYIGILISLFFIGILFYWMDKR